MHAEDTLGSEKVRNFELEFISKALHENKNFAFSMKKFDFELLSIMLSIYLSIDLSFILSSAITFQIHPIFGERRGGSRRLASFLSRALGRFGDSDASAATTRFLQETPVLPKRD